MRKMEDLYDQASAVVQIVDSVSSAHVPIERHDHVLLAMAAVSRCRSLLLGAVEVDRAGRSDILGVIVRALLEVWYFGVIALLGEQEDLDRLEADHRYWKNELAKHLPGVQAEDGVVGKFSVFARAKRVDELVTAIGQQSGVALDYYRHFYAGESLTQAHAGFESMKPYVFEDESGSIGIVHEPEDNGPRYGRLRIAIVMTSLLAGWTWERAGLDGDAFDHIEGLGDPS
jgi:hypothetical protein